MGIVLVLGLNSYVFAVGQIALSGTPGSSILNFGISGSFPINGGSGGFTRSSLLFFNVDFFALSNDYTPSISIPSGTGAINVNGGVNSGLQSISIDSQGGGGDDIFLQFDDIFIPAGAGHQINYFGSGTIDISPNVFGVNLFTGSGTFSSALLGGGFGGSSTSISSTGPYTLTITQIPEPSTLGSLLIITGLATMRLKLRS